MKDIPENNWYVGNKCKILFLLYYKTIFILTVLLLFNIYKNMTRLIIFKIF